MKQHNKKRKSAGYTLLEYCAGAAIIAGVIWTALNTLGGDMRDLLNAIGSWAKGRTASVNQNP
jgi:Flp pilus assembly pilin Flp